MIYLIKIKACLIAAVLALIIVLSAAGAQDIYIQFKNSSDYDGAWNLERDLPSYLIKKMNLNTNIHIQILDPGSGETSATNAGNSLLVDLVLTKFDFYGYNIANYRVGGHNSYKVTVEIKVSIRKNNGSTSYEINKEEKDSKLGLTILGGPGGDEDIGINPYNEIQKLRFGSKEFDDSLYGRALFKCSMDIKKYLVQNSLKK